MNRIGVILNTYKRRNIGLQLEALRGQTVKPADLLVWRNDDWTDEEFRSLAGDVHFCKTSKDFGVWARMLAGQLLRTDFIAVFDDDTVPGCRWLENCLDCYARNPAVYGTWGKRLPFHCYRGGSSHGWCQPSDDIQKVDFCGHGWFFPRWLCFEIGKLSNGAMRAGEDMAVSFAAQRNGFETFTAPHPPSSRELWGSTNGLSLSKDGNAISSTSAGWRGYEAEYRRLRGLGWRLMADG
jgi:hypothetical protein